MCAIRPSAQTIPQCSIAWCHVIIYHMIIIARVPKASAQPATAVPDVAYPDSWAGSSEAAGRLSPEEFLSRLGIHLSRPSAPLLQMVPAGAIAPQPPYPAAPCLVAPSSPGTPFGELGSSLLSSLALRPSLMVLWLALLTGLRALEPPLPHPGPSVRGPHPPGPGIPPSMLTSSGTVLRTDP